MLKSTVSLKAFARARLDQLESVSQRRTLITTDRLPLGHAQRGGTQLISFCDNDYLSLAHDPRLAKAASNAAYAYGTGARASRLVSGNLSLNEILESRLARMKGLQSARVFGSGYLANIGTIPTLAGRGDTIILDELSHSCMHTGARLSGATVRTFAHNDTADAARQITQAKGQVLVLTETVFSMDGDLAPLQELAAVCESHGAWLMTDDAHGFGVFSIDNPAPIQMGTLSKAAGGYGGYVCGPTELTDLLTSRARSFVYTTGLPAPVLAAAITALEIMDAEPQRAEQALANARLFAQLMNLPVPQSVIVPIVVGEENRAMRISEQLQDAGFLVTAIRPPTVPSGTSRLRFTFTTGHRAEDIHAVTRALTDCLASA